MPDQPAERQRSDNSRDDARDWVTPEHLNVAPDLLGAPLARPMRRLAAITIDMIALGLLSSIGNLWLLAGVAIPITLRLRARQAGGTLESRHRGLMVLAWLVAAALVAIGAQQAWRDLQARPPGKGFHGLHIQRGGAADDADAQELAEAASAVASAVPLNAEQRAAARIAILEAQLAEARQPKPFDLQEQISTWADDVGVGLGWAIAYFSFLPVWWNGQTLGKRLLGLRVVELTGKPLTVMRAFKRYGGYAAGMATGMFGFLQVLWDANRQAIQDKTAHTVVLDLRRARRPAVHAPYTLASSPSKTTTTDQEA